MMVSERKSIDWKFDPWIDYRIDPMPIGDVSGNVPQHILESFSMETLKRMSILFTNPKVQKDFLEWKMRKNRKMKKKLKNEDDMKKVELFSILSSNLYEALIYMKEMKPRFTFKLLTEDFYYAR